MLSTWIFIAGFVTIPLTDSLTMPSQPRALVPRELPSHQLHVPGAPSSSRQMLPAHVFAANLRLEIGRAAAAVVSSSDHAAPAPSGSPAAPPSAEHPCIWHVSRGAGAAIASLEVSADGSFRTSVHDSDALLEEASLLEARAQRYFGVPEDSVLGLEPLVIVAALAAQRYRQQKQDSVAHHQREESLELMPCDTLSEQLLAKAQRSGW